MIQPRWKLASKQLIKFSLTPLNTHINMLIHLSLAHTLAV